MHEIVFISPSQAVFIFEMIYLWQNCIYNSVTPKALPLFLTNHILFSQFLFDLFYIISNSCPHITLLCSYSCFPLFSMVAQCVSFTSCFSSLNESRPSVHFFLPELLLPRTSFIHVDPLVLLTFISFPALFLSFSYKIPLCKSPFLASSYFSGVSLQLYFNLVPYN